MFHITPCIIYFVCLVNDFISHVLIHQVILILINLFNFSMHTWTHISSHYSFAYLLIYFISPNTCIHVYVYVYVAWVDEQWWQEKVSYFTTICPHTRWPSTRTYTLLMSYLSLFHIMFRSYSYRNHMYVYIKFKFTNLFYFTLFNSLFFALFCDIDRLKSLTFLTGWISLFDVHNISNKSHQFILFISVFIFFHFYTVLIFVYWFP